MCKLLDKNFTHTNFRIHYLKAFLNRKEFSLLEKYKKIWRNILHFHSTHNTKDILLNNNDSNFAFLFLFVLFFYLSFSTSLSPFDLIYFMIFSSEIGSPLFNYSMNKSPPLSPTAKIFWDVVLEALWTAFGSAW